MDEAVWRGRDPIAPDDLPPRNVIRKASARNIRCSTPVYQKMSAAAWRNQNRKCKICKEPIQMLERGKLHEAELDHIDPLYGRPCRLLAAQGETARLAVVLAEMQVLCRTCHKRKTKLDNEEAARAARTTIFWLFPLRPGSPWTVDELMRQYDRDEMQIQLWRLFQQDLDGDGESLLIYELDELGRPLFSCTCGVKTACTELTWSQDQNSPLLERQERPVMLKPKCSSCGKGGTSPVVIRPTKRPQWSTRSAAAQLTYLRNEGWMTPDDEAQATEWLRKFGGPDVWFRRPS
jgi:5-methylcytosine-specific restriction endonuclease McrA